MCTTFSNILNIILEWIQSALKRKIIMEKKAHKLININSNNLEFMSFFCQICFIWARSFSKYSIKKLKLNPVFTPKSSNV